MGRSGLVLLPPGKPLPEAAFKEETISAATLAIQMLVGKEEWRVLFVAEQAVRVPA
jgi:hypothetical protein